MSSYHDCGFDAVGVAPYKLLWEPLERLRRWTEAGKHGQMEYMVRSLDKRHDLSFLMPGVRSVVVTLSLYRPSAAQSAQVPQVAAFAWGDDYHYVIKDRLNRLLHRIQEHYPQVNGRAVVDSAPTFERHWAQIAGLGYIGRSSMLINETLGSYTIIGLLLLDTSIEAYDVPFDKNLCGTCRACIENCPTSAIGEDRTIDARRCLSYQTIELRGPATTSLQGHLFGCDECLQVCPHNRAAPCRDIAPMIDLTFEQWSEMTSQEFKLRFKNSSFSRAGYEKIQDNLKKLGR